MHVASSGVKTLADRATSNERLVERWGTIFHLGMDLASKRFRGGALSAFASEGPAVRWAPMTTTRGNEMLVPSPKWLDTGSNAGQMAAATLVGLQSIPGLVILYGGIVKKKWALNSAFMAMYAFAAVMVVWVLWAYNMSFGPQLLPFWGTPKPALSAAFLLGHAAIGLPDGDDDVLPVRLRRDHRDHPRRVADRADELQGVDHLRSVVDDLRLHGRLLQHLGRRLARPARRA